MVGAMKTCKAFGPIGTGQYTNYSEWSAAAKARGLVLVPATSGPVAQDGPRGTCRGAWFYNSNKGWLDDRT